LAVRFPVVGSWAPADVKQMGYRRPWLAADARPPLVGRTGVAAEEMATTAHGRRESVA